MASMSSVWMKSSPASADNEPLDDWEQMVDSGVLDEKLRRMKARIPEEPPVRSGEVQSQHFLFNGDGSVKPSLLGPPPQIKILKRPTQNGAGGPGSDSTGAAKPRQQVKTLQQKEAEYAEARLRILGRAAPSPTQDQPADVSLSKRVENLRVADDAACGAVRSPRGPDGTRGFAKTD